MVPLLLIATSLAWGTSFLFIEFALVDMGPAAIAAGRLVLGALAIWIGLGVTGRIARTWREGMDHVRELLLVGLLTALPFTLVGEAQIRIDSGIAGIANAAVPIWAGLIGLAAAHDERPSARGWVGLSIGFLGVVLLAVSRGMDAGGPLLGVGIMVLAGMMYAAGAVYIRMRLRGVSAVSVATWSVTWGALVATIPALFVLPREAPGTPAILSMLALGVLATGIGLMLYYRLLETAGAARATTVTYLLPGWAVFWGWLVLGEPVRPVALAALALIVAGIALNAELRDARS